MTVTRTPRQKLTYQIETLVDLEGQPKGAYLWTIRQGQNLLYCGVRGSFPECEDAVRRTFALVRTLFHGDAVTRHD